MKTAWLVLAAIMIACPMTAADEEGWIRIFDGKTLAGWKANERPENWSVMDGAIHGRGERSHLFYMERECLDCEFKAEAKLTKGSNSGMYFRAQFGPEWPKGYEAQVNNSHGDPIRTGSLYGFVKVFEQLVPDDTWWTQHIIVKGNHIIIMVNGKKTVDYVDARNIYTRGYLALQQHDPGSQVWYRNLMMKVLK